MGADAFVEPCSSSTESDTVRAQPCSRASVSSLYFSNPEEESVSSYQLFDVDKFSRLVEEENVGPASGSHNAGLRVLDDERLRQAMHDGDESSQTEAVPTSAPSSWLDPSEEVNKLAGLVSTLGAHIASIAEEPRAPYQAVTLSPKRTLAAPPPPLPTFLLEESEEQTHEGPSTRASLAAEVRSGALSLVPGGPMPGSYNQPASNKEEAERTHEEQDGAQDMTEQEARNAFMEALLNDPNTSSEFRSLLKSPSLTYDSPEQRAASLEPDTDPRACSPAEQEHGVRRSPRRPPPLGQQPPVSQQFAPPSEPQWEDDGLASPVAAARLERLPCEWPETRKKSADASEGRARRSSAGAEPRPSILKHTQSAHDRASSAEVSSVDKGLSSLDKALNSLDKNEGSVVFTDETLQGQSTHLNSTGGSDEIEAAVFLHAETNDAWLASWASHGEDESLETSDQWRGIEQAVHTFCFETGGGHGTWLPDPEGQSFGLGVEQAQSDADTGGTRISMPAGFAEGRDVRKLLHEQKRKQDVDLLVRPPFPRAVAFGRLSWDSKAKPVQFVRCSTKTDAKRLPHLLRFYAERVWGLKRPGLLVSVVGSALDLDLKVEHRKRLGGIMAVAKETGAWVTTAGFDVGVSKLIAQLRTEADNQVPLIGFAAWGLVEGRHALWEPETDGRVLPHGDKLPLEDFQAHEKHFASACLQQLRSLRLNRDHSHFFLIDDGSVGHFSAEASVRAAFELSSWNEETHSRIRETLVANGLGWQLAHLPDELGARQRKKPAEVPAVAVCVGGNAATMARVLEMLKKGTPVLLVRGTGGEADVVADLVRMLRGRSFRETRAWRSGSDARNRMGREDGFVGISGISRAISTESGDDGTTAAESFLGMDDGGEGREWIGEERWGLLWRALNRRDDAEDEQLAADISAAYAFRTAFRDLQTTLNVARSIADSTLCHIFDLDRSEDVSGAMLAPVLQKQREAGLEWEDCLRLIVQWNHVAIMKRGNRALDRLGTVTAHTRRSVEEAFHLAFKRDEPAMTYCLLEYLDCSNTYDIRVDMSSMWSTALLTVRRRRGVLHKLTAKWEDLVTKALKQLNEEKGGGLALERWSELYEVTLQDEHARRLLGKSRETAEEAGQSAAWRRTRGSGSALSRDMECKRQLKELEAVYRTLCGNEFAHLLMRRKRMLKMLWARMDMPVLSMLTAAAMYRMWEKQDNDLKVHLREALLEDAQEFETVALQVQSQLMRIDSVVALQSCDLRSSLWKGLSAVDLAVRGSSQAFVETCCAEALDCRWTGDIHPYEQRFGLYPSVLLSLLSFGLLAPDLIVFRPPPTAEVLRGPAQTRAIPAGHHERQSAVEPYSDRRSAITQRNMWLKLQSLNQAGAESVLLPEVDAGESKSEGDSCSRREHFQMFWGAPVTIFVVDALQQLFFNSIFTALLVSDSTAIPATKLSWTEIVLCWECASTTVHEIVQLLLEGGVYLHNSWNLMALLACGTFWRGMATHRSTDGGFEQAGIWYGASLFFRWMRMLRVLSVHRAVGPLVIAFSRMRRDVLLFASIWAVLLLAFGAAMQGAQPAQQRNVKAGSNPMFGWGSWWFVRTYYQSIGEPFFNEFTTDASNVVLLIMFPIMNLMLVNLLIAIMNDTYTDVKQSSRLQWMLQMYQLAKECRSLARLNLLMLLYDILQFWQQKSDVDSRTSHLWQQQPGLLGYLLDLRFKYKRFQTRDLPPEDAKEREVEVANKLEELEARALGSSTKNIGIPGRVWKKRKVEWHADVTALGGHQYLRKELAIRCGLHGCVALPSEIGDDADEESGGMVFIFYSTAKMSAADVDKIVLSLHRHQAAQERAATGLASEPWERMVYVPRNAFTPGYFELVKRGEVKTAEQAAEEAAEDASEVVEAAWIAEQHQMPDAKLASEQTVESGGKEPGAAILKGVCEECNLAYAEVFHVSDDRMVVCAYFCRGHAAQTFYNETVTTFVFRRESTERNRDRSFNTMKPEDGFKSFFPGAGWDLRSMSFGRQASHAHEDKSVDGLSSNLTSHEYTEADNAPVANKTQDNEAALNEEKSSLKRLLLAFRLQERQDAESIRSTQHLLQLAQTEYLKANPISADLSR